MNKNPDFLGQFNQLITGCARVRFSVSEYERQKIKELLARKVERWKRLPKLEPLGVMVFGVDVERVLSQAH